MDGKAEIRTRTTAVLRKMARIIGTIIALFWLFIAAAHGFTEPSEMELESTVMVILIIGTSVGVFVCWINERIGGLITLFFGIAHSINALIVSGRNHLFAMLISGVPFIIVGSLFLIVDKRSRNEDLPQITG